MKKIRDLLLKKNKAKVVCLTAYSKNIAQEIDSFVDVILVGDSLGSVLYDFDTTRSVTLEMMINHSKSVRKGITKSLMVVDMPYNTYRNKSEALKNCKKVMRETKCDAVKLEGGNKKIVEIIKHLIKNKIPVMGHLGLLPQNEKGKFTFKGKSSKEKLRLLNEAKVLESIGVFAIVLECVEKKLSKEITDQIKILTIGIGASQHCDGQVLVTDDIIGLTNSKIKFVKEFGNVRKTIRDAVKKYKTEVKSLKYPSKKYLYQKNLSKFSLTERISRSIIPPINNCIATSKITKRPKYPIHLYFLIFSAKNLASVPTKTTDKNNPKINRLILSLATPTIPITLSKLKVISANSAL